jgi:4-diphosphocytidyl-2-C-methyl-D-erythritol kinase
LYFEPKWSKYIHNFLSHFIISNLHLTAPAKINWNLKIGPLQENGLHLIDSEMRLLSLHDEIALTILPEQNGQILFALENPESFEVPETEENIVVKAARAFFNIPPVKGELGGLNHPNIKINLRKHIPSGAGLGGGSSDAAAVLLGLEDIFIPSEEGDDGHHRLQKIASELGSDVSFFFSQQKRAQISGTGEKISPLPDGKKHSILLIKPRNLSIPTPFAYQKWDEKMESELKSTRLYQENGNDFEPAIFGEFPELGDIAQKIRKAGAQKAHLCGSGSTIFGVFKNGVPQKIWDEFSEEEYWKWKGNVL